MRGVHFIVATMVPVLLVLILIAVGGARLLVLAGVAWAVVSAAFVVVPFVFWLAWMWSPLSGPDYSPCPNGFPPGTSLTFEQFKHGDCPN